MSSRPRGVRLSALIVFLFLFSAAIALALFCLFAPAPELLVPENGVSVAQAPAITTEYMLRAREAYSSQTYSDCTSSVVGDFSTSADSFNDRPVPITLDWKSASPLCVVELSDKEDFSSDSTRKYRVFFSSELAISNLYTDTTYYWRVRTAGGVSDIFSFTTENDVRWIHVDGVRNVRDLGGWNGLNQGLVYRGSELNEVSEHGLQITGDGRRTFVRELGVRSDMDFRALTIEGRGEEKYFAESALGSEVQLLNHQIAHFLAAFDDPESYHGVFSDFADPANYPIYMHCWGGADRTGTVAFLLQALCGVSEPDLSIDLELTSFASFGPRYRYDNEPFYYASSLERLRSYEGSTLQEKTEQYMHTTLGLSWGEISNIQSILSGSGVTIGMDYIAGSVISAEEKTPLVIGLECPDGQRVSSVKTGSREVDFSFENGVLTVAHSELLDKGASGGILEITMDDGFLLRSDVEVI